MKKSVRERQVAMITENFKKTTQRLNLYFKNVPLGATHEELNDFFKQFGAIRSLRLCKDKKKMNEVGDD